jgi:ribose/xylose/arabinose/galactoside ABC-type transport system permease subunit
MSPGAKGEERYAKLTQGINLIIKGLFDNIIWVLLGGILIVMGISAPGFFSFQNLITLALNSTILGLMVIAESMCLIIGKFDISIESTLAFAALIGAMLVKAGVSPALAMFAVVCIGAGIGLVNGMSIVLLGANPFMQTLSMNIVFRGLMLVLTGGITIFNFPDAYRIFGDTAPIGIPTPIIVTIVFYVFFIFLLEKRPWGRRLYAIGTNERAAFISGVNVKNISIQVFVLASVIAAFAGLVASTRYNGVPNLLAKGMVFEVFAAAVMGGISLNGGRGRLIGAVGGVLFLGVVTSILTWLRVNAFMVQTARGIIILVAIMIDAFKNKVQIRISIL